MKLSDAARQLLIDLEPFDPESLPESKAVFDQLGEHSQAAAGAGLLTAVLDAGLHLSQAREAENLDGELRWIRVLEWLGLCAELGASVQEPIERALVARLEQALGQDVQPGQVGGELRLNFDDIARGGQ